MEVSPCPGDGLVLCFDMENSKALALDIAKLQAYAAEAYERCGK